MNRKELEAADDKELVRAFNDGNRLAFETLVVRHQGRVYAVCLRTLGSPIRAEEAAQEVLVKVYRHLGRFRGDSKFTTWLYRVALNHCRNVQAYRARRHEKRHDSLDADLESEDGSTRKRERRRDRTQKTSCSRPSGSSSCGRSSRSWIRSGRRS